MADMPARPHIDAATPNAPAERARGDPELVLPLAAASACQQAPAQAMPSLSDGLAQLNALHDRGALSDGEFVLAKVKLLGG